MPTTYKWLAGSSTAFSTTTFSSIPQTYTDLAIHLNLQSTAATNATLYLVRLNGLSASSYYMVGSSVQDTATSTSGLVENAQSSARFYWIPGSNLTTGIQSTSFIYIPNYTVTKRPTLWSQSGFGSQSSSTWSYSLTYAGYNDSSVAGVNSITISTVNNSFTSTGRIDIYGILKN